MHCGTHRGFSLLEVLMVMGLIGIIAGFTFYGGIAPFRHEMTRTQEEYDRARTAAVRGKELRYRCTKEECAAAMLRGGIVHEN